MFTWWDGHCYSDLVPGKMWRNTGLVRLQWSYMSWMGKLELISRYLSVRHWRRGFIVPEISTQESVQQMLRRPEIVPSAALADVSELNIPRRLQRKLISTRWSQAGVITDSNSVLLLTCSPVCQDPGHWRMFVDVVLLTYWPPVWVVSSTPTSRALYTPLYSLYTVHVVYTTTRPVSSVRCRHSQREE